MSMLLAEAPTKDPAAASAGDDLLYRLSADEFERMAEVEAFDRDARVELINGVLVEMSPIGTGHGYVVRQLDRLLQRLLDGRAVVSVQMSLRCGDRSEPEPDLVVAAWPPERYIDRHPAAGDALLVVEVADSSLRYDLTVKVPLYASVGVPEVWVVDVAHRQVHVFTDRKDDGYATSVARTPEDVLAPTAVPDVEVPLAELRLDQLRET
jgi:Uma2 family endonuclease